ncbi:MAG: hypothetical protein AB7F31_00420 [Parachlamydiales bacterium]
MEPENFLTTQFRAQWKIYREEGGRRTEITDEEQLQAIEKLFTEKVIDLQNVHTVVFELGKAGELQETSYDIKGKTVGKAVRWSVKDSPNAAKVYDYIRCLDLGKLAPTTVKGKPGIKNEHNTCFASSFLQHTLDVKLDKRKPQSDEANNQQLGKARDELFNAAKACQDALKKAKQASTTVEVKVVEELLKAAAAVEKARGPTSTWDKTGQAQDFAEFWKFVGDELDLFHTGLDDAIGGQAYLTIQPKKGEKISTVLADSIDETTGYPKLLPLSINRRTEHGKNYTPIEIETSFDIDQKTYELVGVVEHIGTAEKGHNIAYRVEKEQVVRYDDDKVGLLKSKEALEGLQTTASFLIYQLKG